MNKFVKKRIIALHIIISMFVLMIGCPVTVQAETDSGANRVGSLSKAVPAAEEAVTQEPIESKGAEVTGEPEMSQPVTISTEPEISEEPEVSVLPEVSVPPVSQSPVVSSEPVNPVEWKLIVDSKTGAQLRQITYSPLVSGHPSVDTGYEAGVYVWKKGTDEKKAVLAGEKKAIGTSKLVWKIDVTKIKAGYGTYYVKLAVTKNNTLQTKATEHFTVQPSCSSFTTKLTNSLEAKQSFEVNIKGLQNAYGVKGLTFQVYNSKNVRVYKCAGKALNSTKTSYSASISMKNLSYKFGKYTIKAIVTDKKNVEWRIPTTTSISRTVKKGTLKVTNQSDKTIKFTSANAYIPGKIKNVTFKVFRKVDGSKKSKTYSASYSSKTSSYTGKMSISAFPYKKAGTYEVYTYGETKWGKKVLLKTASFHITAAKATVKGSSPNSRKGTFTMSVSKIQSKSGVKSVSVKVWRVGEKTDAATYKAVKQKSGSYKIKVNATKHKYHFGTYHAKAYIVMGNGIKVNAGTCTYTFKPSNFIYMKTSSTKHCKNVYLYNPSHKGTVTFQVYSKVKGNDDLVTYKTKKSGNTYRATIKLAKIKNAGTIIVKARAGKKVLRTYTFVLKKSQLVKNGWLYEKYQGKTYKFYYKDGKKVTDLTKILKIKESNDSNYNDFRVIVNRAASCVTIYAYDSKRKEYCIPVKTCTVSVGRDTWTNKGTEGLHEDSSYTPIGDYSICTNGTSVKYTMKPMYEPDGSIVYARWASHVVGNVYFHSVAVGANSHYALSPTQYNRLGSPASAGCIRMTVADAKWIYDYVSRGTPVQIVKGDASHPGPLGKNATIKISSSIHYDPTDPGVPTSTKEKDYKAGKISGYMTASGKKVGY